MAQNDATTRQEADPHEGGPSYTSPPVIEVVCGVQFEPLQNFKSVHFGEFWQWVKKEYPNTEDNTPIAELFEDRPTTTAPETLETPPLRRVLYIDSPGNFLLQLQPSRFLANWRRMRPDDEYPRFRATYKRFLEGWDLFLRFAQDQRLGTPTANQYELTYINHIVATTQDGFPSEIEQFLPLFSWSRARSSDFLTAPTNVSMRLRFRLPDTKSILHLKIDHGKRRKDDQDVLLVEFTARGPATPDCSNLKSWFAMAHTHIVNGFTDLTPSMAHTHWGRTE